MPVVSIVASTLILGAGLAACAGGEPATGDAEGHITLFTSVSEAEAHPAVADEPWAVRVAVVDLHRGLFAETGPGVGDTLRVELFDGESVLAVIESLDTVAGHRNVRARIDETDGIVLLSVGRETVSGTIRTAGRPHHYYVRHAADVGGHVLIQVDPSREDVVPEAPPEEWP